MQHCAHLLAHLTWHLDFPLPEETKNLEAGNVMTAAAAAEVEAASVSEWGGEGREKKRKEEGRENERETGSYLEFLLTFLRLDL